MAGTSVYGASKAALISLMRTVSGELMSRGIRVNAIASAVVFLASDESAFVAGSGLWIDGGMMSAIRIAPA
jgi:NAD(P)-dependent dehydrogenase (short-subunit alcohol dehydrogenase family)